jgi:hypothetical protein
MVLLKQKSPEEKRRKAQSLIELTLVLSFLLILLTATVEFGVLLNQYINVLDAARTTAREAAAADPIADSALFFNVDHGVPSILVNSLKPLQLNTTCPDNASPGGPGNPCDDVIISVFSVASGQTPVRLYHVSVYENRTSKFTPAQIGARLDASAPNTGLVVIEVYYSYPQMMKLPFVTSFIPDPIPMHVFSVMPLSAAEPTPTPR